MRNGLTINQRLEAPPILYTQSYPSGGAGMAGTANGVLRVLEAIRVGGTPILDPKTVERMTAARVSIPAETQGPGWGLG